MNAKLWIITSVTLAGIITAGLWTRSVEQENEEHEEHEDHTFVHMQADQLEKYGIALNEASAGSLKFVIQTPAVIAIPTDQLAHIYPKASGTVVDAYKNLGEDVDVGDVLALIESQEVAEVKASYLASIKQEALLSKEHDREQKLVDKKVSSEQEYAAAEHSWEEAKIALELAKHKLYALGFTHNDIEEIEKAPATHLSQYKIKSPIKGKVIERNIAIGSLVSKDQEVFEVGNTDNVWAEVNVFSRDRQHMRKGQVVSIATDNNTATGKVLFLSPVVDKSTHTSKAIVLVDNAEGNWLPGSFTSATIITKEVPVSLCISKESIQNIEGNDAVFVVANDGFDVRHVTKGQEDHEFVEILSGLEPGEKVACKNTFLLKAELQKDEAEHMD